MLQCIGAYQNKWKSTSCFISKKVNEYNLATFLKRTLLEEGESLETIKNLEDAYKYLHTIDMKGLLTVDVVKNVHKLILKNDAEAGSFSRNKRITHFNGETCTYSHPHNMETKVQLLIDRYNDLSNYSAIGNRITVNYNLFKICSFFVFELLDLHPFGDGNGRLCRLLASYVLSRITPFPASIYCVSGSRNDFISCLIHARKSKFRQPKNLAYMIIECNYHEWKQFFATLSI